MTARPPASCSLLAGWDAGAGASGLAGVLVLARAGLGDLGDLVRDVKVVGANRSVRPDEAGGKAAELRCGASSALQLRDSAPRHNNNPMSDSLPQMIAFRRKTPLAAGDTHS